MTFLFEKMDSMPKHHTSEVKDRPVPYTMERLDRYKSIYTPCLDLGPKLNVGKTCDAWSSKHKSMPVNVSGQLVKNSPRSKH